MNLYRVFPWDEDAAETELGGAFFVVDSDRNRISNLEYYTTLYLAGQPEAAIAEVLGHLLVWRTTSFQHPIGTLSLATYELDDQAPIFELDDIDSLRSLNIARPSRIITRDRDVTRRWALAIYQRGGNVGARWWSYYNPQWSACGLWQRAGLTLCGRPEPLTIETPAVITAAQAISKQRIL
ncbi:MAG: RES domain-containing protein [Candidatus Baltobacteraceae bacterium]